MVELAIPLPALVPKIEAHAAGQKIIRVLRMRQLLEGDVTDNLEVPYAIDKHPEGGIWNQAAEHTIAAMYVADTLADVMGLSKIERSRVCQAALLHDAGKKTEQMWLHHIEKTNSKDTVKRSRKAREILASLAQMEEAENTLDSGIDPAVSHLMHANIPPVDRKQNVSEKIVWFSDAVLQGMNKDRVLKQHLVPVATRFDELEKNPRSVAFSNLFIPLYGRPLFDVQRELGEKYEQEFSQKLNMTVENFYTWLQERVQEKMQTNELPAL